MKKKYRLKYPGSKFWLVFWILVYFPIGLVLLTNIHFASEGQVSKWDYEGDRFWLYFWAIVFFPITILLILLRGVLVVSSNLT